MSQEGSDFRYLINAVAFSLPLTGAAILSIYPDTFNRPLARMINSLTSFSTLVNQIAFVLTDPTVQGVIAVSLVWYCWFSVAEIQLRAKMVSGTVAAVIAALCAHFLQQTLPITPKPIFDPVLQLQAPSTLGNIEILRTTSVPNFHSFPSERATLFVGLAIALFLVRPRIGMLALGCTMLTELSRIYLGLHYPADLIGAISLSAGMVWLAQMRWSLEFGRWFVRWEQASAATFYMFAYPASYEITNAFGDLRALGSQLLR